MVDYYFQRQQHSSQDPRLDLLGFSHSLQRLLEDLVNLGKYKNLFLSDFSDDIPMAWNEAKVLFLRLNDSIYLLSPDAFIRHGLHGYSLNFKLNLISVRERFFQESLASYTLLQLLKAIDVLLKSLLSATGIGTGIDEFKECLENALKDED